MGDVGTSVASMATAAAVTRRRGNGSRASFRLVCHLALCMLGLPPAPARSASRERVCLAPQSVCYPEWVNAYLCPPCCFVAASMNFAVMSTAQWNRELITHLASQCSALCKSEVVRIGRTPTANQTGMSCDEFHMFSIADSTRLRMDGTAFFDLLDGGSPGQVRSYPLTRTLRGCE